MKSTICTLFEGHYHYGVAALANSLCREGFRGRVYAGYRGELPKWSSTRRSESVGKWQDASIFQVDDGIEIVFLPLSTDYHLTNYKPDFMLDLLSGPASEAESMFYFDPDIVVNERWAYFVEWVSCGVALCEDVNSSYSENHPRRLGWRRFFATKQLRLSCKSEQYVNGGCIGVLRDQIAFLEAWKQNQELMGEVIGGLSAAKIPGGKPLLNRGFANCFDASDQDALNATVERCSFTCSILGQEAMAFKPGKAILPHALGSGKPWARSYLVFALRGRSPRTVDKLYWLAAFGPVKAHSTLQVGFKRISIKLASFIGRFYRVR